MLPFVYMNAGNDKWQRIDSSSPDNCVGTKGENGWG